MLKKSIKRSAITLTTALTLSLGLAGLSATAQAAKADKKSSSISQKLKSTHNFKSNNSATPHSSQRIDFTKRQIPGLVRTPKSR